jgi:hypothetical protein
MALAVSPQTRGERSPSPEQVQAQADTVVIQIVADADSVIAVPGSVTVAPGQVVTWATDLGDWMVRFGSAQPFGNLATQEGIRGARGQRRGQAVRNEAAEGSYKYDIMVVVQGGQNLRADPEIVVKRRELP